HVKKCNLHAASRRVDARSAGECRHANRRADLGFPTQRRPHQYAQLNFRHGRAKTETDAFPQACRAAWLFPITATSKSGPGGHEVLSSSQQSTALRPEAAPMSIAACLLRTAKLIDGPKLGICTSATGT